jgi:hypothetical protein
VALSALSAPEAREHARRWFLPRRQGQRIGQVAQVVLAGNEVAGGAKALDRATVWQWGKDGDGAAPVGDFDRLAGLDPPQQFARSLPEFAYSYGGVEAAVHASGLPGSGLAAALDRRCRTGASTMPGLHPLGALAEANGYAYEPRHPIGEALDQYTGVGTGELNRLPVRRAG